MGSVMGSVMGNRDDGYACDVAGKGDDPRSDGIHRRTHRGGEVDPAVARGKAVVGTFEPQLEPGKPRCQGRCPHLWLARE